MHAEEIAKAVGHIPSGLFIVSSNNGSVSDGYLASWVQQVSFNPLVIAFAISDSRPGYDVIKSGKPFAVNVVGDHNMNYLKHFWRGYSPEDNPFSNKEIRHKVLESGATIIEEAKSSIECEFISSEKPGDHEIIFARVLNSYIHDEEAKPKVHIRKSGLDY
jgi:flavin reductase (DIM6/NTAB) family NADH-FMN oxidoreductase RutF